MDLSYTLIHAWYDGCCLFQNQSKMLLYIQIDSSIYLILLQDQQNY